MEVEEETQYSQEVKTMLKNIETEITQDYGNNVLKWVKDKLDQYIVGEDKNKILLWLIMVSKDLDEPLHASIEGRSSIGKSTLVNRVLEALPEDSIEKLTRITPTYLDYVKDKLKHKILLVQQLGGAESSQDTLHVLMTEKGLRLGTVKRVEGGTWEPYFVEAEGPISFITTTVETTKLDEQFRTRVWRLFLDDSPEQTLKIQRFNGLLKKKPWMKKRIMKEVKRIALYIKYLGDYGVKNILIPYGEDLILRGRNIRLRRDQLKLLDLISVIAYVTQFYNHHIIEIEGEKYVAANKHDLNTALDIARDVLKQTVLEVSKAEEDILRICREIRDEYDSNEMITTREVARRSGGKYSQSTCRKYMNHLVDLGYLYIMQEGGKGRGQQNIYELSQTDFKSDDLISKPDVDDQDLVEYFSKYYPDMKYTVYMYKDLYTMVNLSSGEEYSLHLLSRYPTNERTEDMRDLAGITETLRDSHLISQNLGSSVSGKNAREMKTNGSGGYDDSVAEAFSLKIKSGESLTLDEILFLQDHYPDLYREYEKRMI